MNAIQHAPHLLALALGAGLLATGSRAAEPPQAPLKLAGTWKLNKGLSEDPARKMMEGMRAGGGSEHGGRPGGGGGMGGPGGGGGGMGGPGGGGGGMGGGGREGSGGGMGGPGGGRGPGRPGGAGYFGGEPPLDGAPGEERPHGERTQGQGRNPLAPSSEFTIDQEGDNLAFRTENNLRLLHTDGEKRKKEGEAGRLEVVAKFVKGALVIESRPETGGKRRETYTLQADGKLQIDFDFEGSGPMPALKFKLVYDAAQAPQF